MIVTYFLKKVHQILHEKCSYGVFLVRISKRSDWIRRDTTYLSVFSQNAWKFGPEKLWIRTHFTQWMIFDRILDIGVVVVKPNIVGRGRGFHCSLHPWLNHKLFSARSRRKRKINFNFPFQTSLWYLNRFYEGLKSLHKTFWCTKEVWK